MERLDKIITQITNYSRKEVKELIRKKRIMINGQLATKTDVKIEPEATKITIDEIELQFKKNIYLILNKPKGYISATEDKNQKTILDLVPKKYLHRNLFPVGRLDKDTTGLMIITDDGEFAHNILSPKKHIKKQYNVTIDIPMTDEMVIGFKEGVSLIDGDCKSAKLEIISKNINRIEINLFILYSSPILFLLFYKVCFFVVKIFLLVY